MADPPSTPASVDSDPADLKTAIEKYKEFIAQLETLNDSVEKLPDSVGQLIVNHEGQIAEAFTEALKLEGKDDALAAANTERYAIEAKYKALLNNIGRLTAATISKPATVPVSPIIIELKGLQDAIIAILAAKEKAEAALAAEAQVAAAVTAAKEQAEVEVVLAKAEAGKATEAAVAKAEEATKAKLEAEAALAAAQRDTDGAVTAALAEAKSQSEAALAAAKEQAEAALEAAKAANEAALAAENRKSEAALAALRAELEAALKAKEEAAQALATSKPVVPTSDASITTDHMAERAEAATGTDNADIEKGQECVANLAACELKARELQLEKEGLEARLDEASKQEHIVLSEKVSTLDTDDTTALITLIKYYLINGANGFEREYSNLHVSGQTIQDVVKGKTVGKGKGKGKNVPYSTFKKNLATLLDVSNKPDQRPNNPILNAIDNALKTLDTMTAFLNLLSNDKATVPIDKIDEMVNSALNK